MLTPIQHGKDRCVFHVQSSDALYREDAPALAMLYPCAIEVQSCHSNALDINLPLPQCTLRFEASAL